MGHEQRLPLGRAVVLGSMVCLAWGSGGIAHARTLNVDDDAALGGDGQSWATAYRYLQDALLAAGEDPTVDAIQVAEGVYWPDRGEAGQVTPGDRGATFQLLDGLNIRGGYAGLGAADPDARDIDAYPSVLSGDLLGDDIDDLAAGFRCFSGDGEPHDEGCGAFDADGDGDIDCLDLGVCDNSEHVVTASGVDESAQVEGLTIMRGFFASGSSDPEERLAGAGVYNEGGSPAFAHCTFALNRADEGSAMYNLSSPGMTIMACRFTENVGSAIRNEHTLMSVFDTAFEFNTYGCIDDRSGSLLLERCTIESSIAPQIDDPGAVTVRDSTATISECVFRDNTGDRGGAIFSVDAYSAVSNCHFERNSVALSVPFADGGGAIYAAFGQLLVTDSTFAQNSARTTGGAISVVECRLEVMESNFSGNEAGRGGAIASFWPRDAQELKVITDCSFVGNTAADGGAVTLQAPATISRCTFESNMANGDSPFLGGGGILGINDIMVSDCTFTANSTSNGPGGGIHNVMLSGADGGPVVTDCNFTENSAASGGGIYLEDGNSTIRRCVFTDNSVYGDDHDLLVGGGLCADSCNLTVTDCMFTGNSVGGPPTEYGYGGGLHTVDSFGAVHRCTFESNDARFGTGGGMNVWHGDVHVSHCTFHQNVAELGGGLHVDSTDTLISQCRIIGNLAHDSYFLNAEGGGARILGTTTLSNCTVLGNTADLTGGGVYCVDPGSSIMDSIVTGNIGEGGMTEATQIGYANIQPTVQFNCIEGLDAISGTGNIDVDPLFLRPPNDGGDGWGDDPDTPDVDEGVNDDYADVRLRPASPCIDAGDPTSEYSLEPEPNGDRVNMGAFGNTPQATPAAWFWDFNDDDAVNLDDYVLWAACVTGPDAIVGPECEAYDTNYDGYVDMLDLNGLQRAFGAER